MDYSKLIEKNLDRVWIMGDEHFNHMADFIWQPRGFSNAIEMREQLLLAWQMVLLTHGEDVICIHLGDVFMNTFDKLEITANRINFGTQLFNRGNHMNDKKRIKLEEMGWGYIGEQMTFRYGNREIALSHYPLDMRQLNANRTQEEATSLPIINVHAHTHSKEFFTAPYQVCVSADALECQPIKLKDAIRAAVGVE